LATKRSSPAVPGAGGRQLFGKMPGHKGIIVNIGNARQARPKRKPAGYRGSH